MDGKARLLARLGRLLLALLLLPAAAAAAQTISGRWLLDFEADGTIQLTFKRSDQGHGNWTSSDDYRLEDFRGLQPPKGSAHVPAAFEMVRDAGTVKFEG